MTNYNDGLWHGWNGGECPVHPETVVEFFAPANAGTLEWLAREVEWDCAANPVVAFRVIKEHKEPREWWLTSINGMAWASQGNASTYASMNGGVVVHVREVLE